MTTPHTNTLQEYGRVAADTIERQRIPAASAIQRAAHVLETKAGSWNAGQKAAKGLHNAACYVRDHDLKTMQSELGRTVRRNPGYAMLAAAGAGFLLARSIFRR